MRKPTFKSVGLKQGRLVLSASGFHTNFFVLTKESRGKGNPFNKGNFLHFSPRPLSNRIRGKDWLKQKAIAQVAIDLTQGELVSIAELYLPMFPFNSHSAL